MTSSLPAKLKSIGHYIKIANEHSNRDPVIYYWCLVYSVQTGMGVDKKSPECVQYLSGLLNTLEQVKKSLAGYEAVTNEVVAQAHIEEYGLKLFAHADSEDRTGNFNKNVVKAFYTAGHIFDVLTLFGELDEEINAHRKYAKWKAAYIHNCLKNGETPVPGPMPSENENEAEDIESGQFKSTSIHTVDKETAQIGFENVPEDTRFPDETPNPESAGNVPISGPHDSFHPSSSVAKGGTELRPQDFQKAQKLCKYAISAMEYEDTATAIVNLEKALHVLKP